MTVASCLAPHTSLRFMPNGQVHTCKVNDDYVLGRVGEQSIAEIWASTRVADLRRALAQGDYSLGCGSCAGEHQLGNRLQTHAHLYDRFEPAMNATVGPRYPARLELALSNVCNLRCLMCNGELSSTIRSQRERRPPLRSPYDDAFFDELAEFLPHADVVVFLGGEPFLCPHARRVWDLMDAMGLHPEVHVTTNGTVWNDQVARYIDRFKMHVALSMDGLDAATNESLRVGTDQGEAMANRERLHAATQRAGSSFVLNHCLMVQNWHQLGAFLVDATERDESVYVIPVTDPVRFSLFRLEADELAPIVASLDAQDAQLRPRLGRNTEVWDRSRDHLRGHLDRLHGGTAVWVTGPSLGHSALAREQVEAGQRAELAAWTDREPLQLDLVDGILTAVDGPPWAELLHLDDFVGQREHQVMAAIMGAIGTVTAMEQDEPVLGVTRSTLGFDTSDGPVEFRNVQWEWNEAGRHHQRILSASRDAPSAP